VNSEVVKELGIQTKFIGPIAIADIHESKANPRRDFADLDDLAASIRVNGVLSPIMIREVNGKPELIYGARRLRAAAKAGLEKIPAIMALCSDEEANAIRIIENGQRADVHPLHEAQAIQKMFDKGNGITIENVAGRLGRPAGYIRRRLELLGLPKEAQDALLDGRMVLGVAQLIAGLPQASAREQAWKALENEFSGALKDIATAREEIRRSVLPDLSEAPFKLDQEDLGGKLACVRCPSRTTSQADLFGQSKGAGNCLEPKCYQAKLSTAYDAAAAAMKKSGKGTILTAKENKQVFLYGGSPSNGYVEASREHWTGTRNVKVSQIMKDHPEKALLAKGPDGEPVIVFRSKDVTAAGKKAAKRAPGPTDKQKETEAKYKRELAIEEFVEGFVSKRMVDSAVALPDAELIDLLGKVDLYDDTADLEEEPFKNSTAARVFAANEVSTIAQYKSSKSTVQQRIHRHLLAERVLGMFGRLTTDELDPYLKLLDLKGAALRKEAELAFELEEKRKADISNDEPAGKQQKRRNK
jgi:ParB/RepB/Spo0J family partition protein